MAVKPESMPVRKGNVRQRQAGEIGPQLVVNLEDFGKDPESNLVFGEQYRQGRLPFYAFEVVWVHAPLHLLCQLQQAYCTTKNYGCKTEKR